MDNSVSQENDKLQLAADSPAASCRHSDPWVLLVVDDEKVVHSVTRLALEDFELGGRGLQMISAYSAAEAQALLQQRNDIAVILLDVVMETDHAGLELARYIREELGNNLVRIILRTGQAGQAPEHEVISRYDINDYKEKTELTRQKLFSTVYTALRSYRDLSALDNNRHGLLRVIEASAAIFEHRQMHAFYDGVLEQMIALLYLNRDAMLIRASGIVAEASARKLQILASAGKFTDFEGEVSCSAFDEVTRERLRSAFEKKTNNYGDNYWVSYYQTQAGTEQLLYVSARDDFSVPDIQMIELFVRNVAIAHDNVELIDSLRDGKGDDGSGR
jgi:CheY-like chemotaxis protein